MINEFKNIKIFIGLTEIAGYYSGLKQGFNDLGLKSTYISLNDHKFFYGEDDSQAVLPFKLLKSLLSKKNTINEKHKIIRFFYILLFHFIQFYSFLWALIFHDVFIFGFKSSFFSSWYFIHNIHPFLFLDYLILRILGKTVIHVFHGSDSRMPYIDGAYIDAYPNLDTLVEFAHYQAHTNRLVEKYATYNINHLPQIYAQEKPFINWFCVGVRPTLINTSTPKNSFHYEKIRILHAPSNCRAKGTEEIRKCIKNIKEKGFDLEYIEISNKSNKEVLSTLATVDFVVDQVYSDTPLAGLAVEAAFLGKPTVVGGYYSEFNESFEINSDIPPSLFCLPHKMEESIIKMIEDTDFRQELGNKAHDFVVKHYSSSQIAQNFLLIATKMFPKNWLCYPQKNVYFGGWGVSNFDAKKILFDIYTKYGTDGFHLKNEVYIQKLIDFAVDQSPGVNLRIPDTEKPSDLS